jgi:hypothetical protein
LFFFSGTGETSVADVINRRDSAAPDWFTLQLTSKTTTPEMDDNDDSFRRNSDLLRRNSRPIRAEDQIELELEVPQSHRLSTISSTNQILPGYL